MTIVAIICLIIGAILTVFSIFSVILSLKDTPTNLSGFYGSKYKLISLAGLVGGIVLIVVGILILVL